MKQFLLFIFLSQGTINILNCSDWASTPVEDILRGRTTAEELKKHDELDRQLRDEKRLKDSKDKRDRERKIASWYGRKTR